MFEPFLNHVSVSGGFPAHLQFKVTSESTSTVVGWGSTNRMGPTGDTETDNRGWFMTLDKGALQPSYSSKWVCSGMSASWLTVNVHQDADVGLPHSVENQTGDRLSEKGVVSFGGEHALPGALQHHTPLSPPGDQILKLYIMQIEAQTLSFQIVLFLARNSWKIS